MTDPESLAEPVGLLPFVDGHPVPELVMKVLAKLADWNADAA